jgi:hypothetical protein
MSAGAGEGIEGMPGQLVATAAVIIFGAIIVSSVADGATGRGATTDDLRLGFYGRSVSRVEGSNLENQPVAFITYRTPGAGGALTIAVQNGLEAAFLLAPIVLVALVAGRILGIVPSFGVIE